MNRASEATFDEQRESTAVVDVRVTEDNRINVARHERKWFSVTRILRSATLNQPAIQQNGAGSYSQDVARTRYFCGCTKELDVHGRDTSTTKEL